MSVGRATNTIENPFLTLPVTRLFLTNALPMAVVMSTSGLLNVVDGIFVGRFIGAQALAAVSLAFPVVMLLTALTTLTGGGMSSLLARHLGKGARRAAGAVFAGAHGLALFVSAGLILGALTLGPGIVSFLAAGNEPVAAPAKAYLLILILGAPVQFALGLHADALRNEGRSGHIAVLSVIVNLLNVAANYIAIVLLDLGVAGSAIGTVAAQALGLTLLLWLRKRDPALLPLAALWQASWLTGWRQILSLGLPLSLSFVGMALVASTVLLAIGNTAADHGTYVAAYGIVTRILGLAFLPQMAIALTTQSITGNNVGAGRTDRAGAGLRLAIGCAFLWCLCVALAGMLAGETLGALFSENQAVITAVGAIMRPMTALYGVTGPILVVALHFQAMGHPLRTAVLTLIKPWVLTPALVALLNAHLGVQGLWLAFPVADAALFCVSVTMVFRGRIRDAPAATLRPKEGS
ncbi:Multidrug export protein MepA [Aquimixticola soesokkakensis]|uniref:Multidrug export protein MepA n=1 Tax=Aquimixticola soesokkakensis TaxID=1519096 RepID=A0A1Y5S3F4_9RHOB|nr:MATE family efflux transporter [Aquimixticola soesokkakensis]SLN29133.1 Multidrug export protein MepA [Aquimixticola soesokkakensis]